MGLFLVVSKVTVTDSSLRHVAVKLLLHPLTASDSRNNNRLIHQTSDRSARLIMPHFTFQSVSIFSQLSEDGLPLAGVVEDPRFPDTRTLSPH